MNCRNSNTKMKAHVNKHNTKCHIQITIVAALLTNSLRPNVELEDIGLPRAISVGDAVSACALVAGCGGGGRDPSWVVPATAEPVALDGLSYSVAARAAWCRANARGGDASLHRVIVVSDAVSGGGAAGDASTVPPAHASPVADDLSGAVAARQCSVA